VVSLDTCTKTRTAFFFSLFCAASFNDKGSNDDTFALFSLTLFPACASVCVCVCACVCEPSFELEGW
jgi:hypothetical protein